MGLFEVTGMWMLAIGKTAIHSLWIGLLVLALLRLSVAHIPVRLSRLRYGISVTALLLLFFSVISAFLMLYEPESPRMDVLSFHEANSFVSGKLLIINNGETTINTSLLFTLFGYIYFVGALFMLLRSLASVAYIKGLRDNGTKLAPPWQIRFTRMVKSLGIERKVDFLESARVRGPQLIGYLKPAVIVPAGMLSMLPVSQVEAIIMHELYHLKRRDYLINILQLFIEGVLFYHPVVWTISGFIRSEREHCCDDGVLDATDNPVNYAKALIHIAEQQHFTRLAPGAVGSAKHHFSSRIRRILNYDTMKTNMRDKVLALALLAGSLIILLTVSSFSEGPAFIRIDKMNSEKILVPADPPEIAVADTIPQKGKKAKLDEVEEMEEAHLEALEEMEEARLEALEELEEIDWEEMKEEMEEARLEALEELEEIDWEEMKEEMKAARQEIEEIDWEEVKAEMDRSFSEMKVDMEAMKIEIENSMKEIDWDEIKEDMKEDLEKVKLSLDSIKIEMDL